jgi:hypothetical protein
MTNDPGTDVPTATLLAVPETLENTSDGSARERAAVRPCRLRPWAA